MGICANAVWAGSTQPPDGSKSAPATIPVEEVAPAAAAVARLLGSFAESLLPNDDMESIRRALPRAGAELDVELERTRSLLKEQPSLETLQSMTQLWQQRQLQLKDWLTPLTEHTTRLQDALNQLDSHHETWTRTRDTLQAANAPAAVLRQIEETLGAIAAARPINRAQRDAVLDLQGQVAQEVMRCEAARSQIAQLQQGAVGGVFARSDQPIWQPGRWEQWQLALPARLRQVLATYREDSRAYLRDPSKHMPLHLALFLLAFVAMLAARGQVHHWAAEGKDVSRVSVVFNHPFAAALLLALMAATAIPAPTPFSVKQVFGAVAVMPMIVLARPVVSPQLVPPLYAVGVLFALDTLRHVLGGIPPLIDQSILLFESLTGGLLLAWLLVRSGPQVSPDTDMASQRHPLRRLLAVAVLIILAVGFLAGLFGYLRLARLTTPAILIGVVDALWIYAAVEVATAVIAYALRVWPLRNTYMVRHHTRFLEMRLHRWLVWIAIIAWSIRYLDYLGLLEPTLARAGALLATRLELGSISTSPGDVLAFVLTLVAAYWLSAMIRFVLQEEIYPRAGIRAGISYAASSVFHYGIVTIAFLLALGFLGVTLTQVTVLAGALGVGIGFGLQGVVNNFVSGLILLFERPINVGDAVQIGDLQGWVRRIGIRASVVRTVQGSEIIVPNAQLTTEQVTNWTLSDQQRRLDLPVGLSYGTAPNQVIDLLEGVAKTIPGVLQDPPPRCYFMGYGDSSINFELRAWTEFATWIQVQSELTVAMYNAVYGAGMSFPFPQREVRILSDPPAAVPASSR